MVNAALLSTILIQQLILVWGYGQFITLKIGKLAYVIFPLCSTTIIKTVIFVLGINFWDTNWIKTVIYVVVYGMLLFVFSASSKRKMLAVYGVGMFLTIPTDILVMLIVSKKIPSLFAELMAGIDSARLICNVLFCPLYFLLVFSLVMFFNR